MYPHALASSFCPQYDFTISTLTHIIITPVHVIITHISFCCIHRQLPTLHNSVCLCSDGHVVQGNATTAITGTKSVIIMHCQLFVLLIHSQMDILSYICLYQVLQSGCLSHNAINSQQLLIVSCLCNRNRPVLCRYVYPC